MAKKNKKMRPQRIRILKLFFDPELHYEDEKHSHEIVSEIQKDHGASETSIRMQISKLLNEGYIRNIKRGFYQITEQGKELINNDGKYGSREISPADDIGRDRKKKGEK